MNKKRLIRDQKWFFQYFPYHQIYMDNEWIKGWVAINYLTDGEKIFWEFEKAGSVPVCGKDMIWLTMIPDNTSRSISAFFLPDRRVSAWYIDIIEETGVDKDGVVFFVDKYLDVLLTPEGDVRIDDRDELDAAYDSGEISIYQYEAAINEAERIVMQKHLVFVDALKGLREEDLISACKVMNMQRQTSASMNKTLKV